MNRQQTSLDGRVAVVTGAARGLGLAIARELAEAGALVYCADVSSCDASAASLREIRNSPGGFALTLDVCDRSAVAGAFEDVRVTHGRLDIVVNNAGIGQQFAPLQELDAAEIARVVEVDLLSVISCCAEAAPRISDGTGRIVNIASHYGLVGRACYGPYSAAKAGVIALTQSLALELAPRGVTVNSVCPGTMLTDMLRNAYEERAVAAGLGAGHGEDLLAEFERESIPLRRHGNPQDVGAMVAWLASDAASFTTGSALNVAGGETLH